MELSNLREKGLSEDVSSRGLAQAVDDHLALSINVGNVRYYEWFYTCRNKDKKEADLALGSNELALIISNNHSCASPPIHKVDCTISIYFNPKVTVSISVLLSVPPHFTMQVLPMPSTAPRPVRQISVVDTELPHGDSYSCSPPNCPHN